MLYYEYGEYEDEGICFYGFLIDVECIKEYLVKVWKFVKEFKKIVLDLDWLESLEYYI